MSFNFPNDFFDPPPNRDESWPDHPELRRAVDWLKSFMSEKDWIKRRETAAKRLYAAALGQLNDPTGKGRFFAENDTFGWYLFLAEAFLDHFWNYEPVFGSRIVPVLISIGRDLPLLQSIQNLDIRIRRMVGPEKRQPNGGLFELLVAAAYLRNGARVELIEEKPGKKRTHDMNVELDGQIWAVECKRMETGAYGEHERTRMRELWGPSSAWLAREEKSVFCDVHFTVEIDTVPADYLTNKVIQWLKSPLLSFSWDDKIGNGVIGNLDLAPLQTVLATDYVLGTGPQMFELLTGRYARNESYITSLRTKPAGNPRFIEECDLAILLRWESTSPASIDGKARDILSKLSEATDQLPDNVPSIIHIGFEAVEGDRVEKARYEKILATANRFNPGSKNLEYIYCHYFVPESPPDQAWSYEETTQWCEIRPRRPRPLKEHFLILPSSETESRPGPHWQ